MRAFVVARDVDLGDDGALAEVNLATGKGPFLPNHTVVVCLASADLEDSELALQGRNAGGAAEWATLKDIDGNDVELTAPGVQFFNVVLTERIRVLVTEETGAGEGSVTLLAH